jgi:hypothetical protein
MENVSEVFVANGVAPNNYTEYSLIQTIATLFDLYGTKIVTIHLTPRKIRKYFLQDLGC